MAEAHLQEHLSRTWQLLAGMALHFVPTTITADQLTAQRYYLVSLRPCASDQRGGVGLVLSEVDARQLTATMFAMTESELTEADIGDACGELCNVIAGGVGPYFSHHETIDLGLPSSLRSDQFQRIFGASAIDGVFEAMHEGRRILVVIFEPMEIPPDTGFRLRE